MQRQSPPMVARPRQVKTRHDTRLRCSNIARPKLSPSGPKKTLSRFYPMRHTKFVLCSATALLALGVACSKSPQTPASPRASSRRPRPRVLMASRSKCPLRPPTRQSTTPSRMCSSLWPAESRGCSTTRSIPPTNSRLRRGGRHRGRLHGHDSPDRRKHGVLRPGCSLDFDATTPGVCAPSTRAPSGRGRRPPPSRRHPAGTSAATNCSTR